MSSTGHSAEALEWCSFHCSYALKTWCYICIIFVHIPIGQSGQLIDTGFKWGLCQGLDSILVISTNIFQASVSYLWIPHWLKKVRYSRPKTGAQGILWKSNKVMWQCGCRGEWRAGANHLTYYCPHSWSQLSMSLLLEKYTHPHPKTSKLLSNRGIKLQVQDLIIYIRSDLFSFHLQIISFHFF